MAACDCLRLPRSLWGWPELAHLESETQSILEIRIWARNKHPTTDDRSSLGKIDLSMGPEMGPENDMHF